MEKVDVPGNSIAQEIPDAEVITRVLGGEKNLYAILVRRYNERLYRVGISIINNDTEVEDVMQSAYIKAYENLEKFSFKADFSTWLTRILINECLLILRKRKYSIKLNGNIMENEIFRQHNLGPATPAQQALNAELKTILEKAILDLPEKYRTVFIMREIQNMNVAETKACLEISGINVKVRLNRAKALLRKSLKIFYKNEDIFNFHLSRCDRMVSDVLHQISPG
jgi:RNA polymerase sigma factor (sigma-70 family)